MDEPRTRKPLNGPERPTVSPVVAVAVGIVVVFIIFAVLTMI